jgi:predicted component of type VI protein secretion system
VLTATLRSRSAALHDFLDMLSHRLVAFFARRRQMPHQPLRRGRCRRQPA